MLLFNIMEDSHTKKEAVFQNISCYRLTSLLLLTVFVFLHFKTSHVIV